MGKFEKYRNVDGNYVVPDRMFAAVLSGTGYDNFNVKQVRVPLP
jgi:hypothetical protein